ncbi:hypothetical protein V6x_59820 [Gimesia chilikensis]|uniref:Uncharacterized protein n=1 Tax=Gimesia chilikensis TaxID=2605989 RepID=A0A517WLW5_9PLAN|nr:hypothetical protein V6x_59820 [Gimesia chilikensis]
MKFEGIDQMGRLLPCEISGWLSNWPQKHVCGGEDGSSELYS